MNKSIQVFLSNSKNRLNLSFYINLYLLCSYRFVPNCKNNKTHRLVLLGCRTIFTIKQKPVIFIYLDGHLLVDGCYVNNVPGKAQSTLNLIKK